MEIRAGSKAVITGMGNKNTEYHTDIYDAYDEKMILNTPTEEGHAITFTRGIPYRLVLNQSGSLYQTEIKVIRQYHDYGFLLTEVYMTEPLKKFQRRQYYRLPCTIKARGVAITEPDNEKTLRQAEAAINGGDDTENKVIDGIILNISGGGAYMTCKKDLEDTPQILLLTELDERMKNGERVEKKKAMFLADILEKTYNDDKKKYSYRLEFIFSDEKERERLVKYVLDEQLKARRAKLS